MAYGALTQEIIKFFARQNYIPIKIDRGSLPRKFDLLKSKSNVQWILFSYGIITGTVPATLFFTR